MSSRRVMVLTGGRLAGVMAAASRGAVRVDGHLLVGVLPDEGSVPFPHSLGILMQLHPSIEEPRAGRPDLSDELQGVRQPGSGSIGKPC